MARQSQMGGSRRVVGAVDLLAQGMGTLPGPRSRSQLFSDSESDGESPRQVMTASKVLFQGNLIKSPPIASASASSMKSWKKRWFVLFADQRWLLYFKDEFSFIDGTSLSL